MDEICSLSAAMRMEVHGIKESLVGVKVEMDEAVDMLKALLSRLPDPPGKSFTAIPSSVHSASSLGEDQIMESEMETGVFEFKNEVKAEEVVEFDLLPRGVSKKCLMLTLEGDDSVAHKVFDEMPMSQNVDYIKVCPLALELQFIAPLVDGLGVIIWPTGVGTFYAAKQGLLTRKSFISDAYYDIEGSRSVNIVELPLEQLGYDAKFFSKGMDATIMAKEVVGSVQDCVSSKLEKGNGIKCNYKNLRRMGMDGHITVSLAMIGKYGSITIIWCYSIMDGMSYSREIDYGIQGPPLISESKSTSWTRKFFGTQDPGKIMDAHCNLLKHPSRLRLSVTVKMRRHADSTLVQRMGIKDLAETYLAIHTNYNDKAVDINGDRNQLSSTLLLLVEGIGSITFDAIINMFSQPHLRVENVHLLTIKLYNPLVITVMTKGGGEPGLNVGLVKSFAVVNSVDKAEEILRVVFEVPSNSIYALPSHIYLFSKWFHIVLNISEINGKCKVSLFVTQKMASLKKLTRRKGYIDDSNYTGSRKPDKEVTCEGTLLKFSFYFHCERALLTIVGFKIKEAGVSNMVPESKRDDGSNGLIKSGRFLLRMSFRVLLIEVDDSNRHIISVLLRKCSYKVAYVVDGLEAWEILKVRPHVVDLILTKVDLPRIFGFALLTFIMEHETCKNIPIILMSSKDAVRTIYNCIFRGVADYLVKPIWRNEQIHVGLMYFGSCNEEVARAIIFVLIDRSESNLTMSLTRLLPLALGFLYLGKQGNVEVNAEMSKAFYGSNIKCSVMILLYSCYAGIMSILKTQHLLSRCVQHLEKGDTHMGLVVLGIAMVMLTEELCKEMIIQSLHHLLQYGELNIGQAVLLTLGLLCIDSYTWVQHVYKGAFYVLNWNRSIFKHYVVCGSHTVSIEVMGPIKISALTDILSTYHTVARIYVVLDLITEEDARTLISDTIFLYLDPCCDEPEFCVNIGRCSNKEGWIKKLPTHLRTIGVSILALNGYSVFEFSLDLGIGMDVDAKTNVVALGWSAALDSPLSCMLLETVGITLGAYKPIMSDGMIWKSTCDVPSSQIYLLAINGFPFFGTF